MSHLTRHALTEGQGIQILFKPEHSTQLLDWQVCVEMVDGEPRVNVYRTDVNGRIRNSAEIELPSFMKK